MGRDLDLNKMNRDGLSADQFGGEGAPPEKSIVELIQRRRDELCPTMPWECLDEKLIWRELPHTVCRAISSAYNEKEYTVPLSADLRKEKVGNVNLKKWTISWNGKC